MLVSNKKLQLLAEKKKYAVGAFNICNIESIQAVVNAAILEKSPAIIATTQGAISYADHQVLAESIKILTKRTNIPFSLHLDHGTDLNIIKNCINLGYSSVMIDASHKEFYENIRITKKVVNLAHKKGISVEAELGTIGGTEDNITAKKIILTEPSDAKEFIEKSGCDTLAVAIGTSHGAYKFTSKSKLDIKRLQQIKKITKAPLVLHGASEIPPRIIKKATKFGAKLGQTKGVSKPNITSAIKNGISKVNIDSDLRLVFTAAIRELFKKQPTQFDPRKIIGFAREQITNEVRYKMKMFGSTGKAKK